MEDAREEYLFNSFEILFFYVCDPFDGDYDVYVLLSSNIIILYNVKIAIRFYIVIHYSANKFGYN